MLGILEEVDDFGNLDLGLGESCHVAEGDLVGVVLVKKSRLGLADVEDASTAPCPTHATEQEEPECNKQQDGSKGIEYHREVVAALDVFHFAGEGAVGPPGLDGVLELVGTGYLRGDPVGCDGRRHPEGGLLLAGNGGDLLGGQGVFQECFGLVLGAIDGDVLHTPLLNNALELGPVGLDCRVSVLVHPEHGQQEDSDECIHPEDVELGLLVGIIFIGHCDVSLKKWMKVLSRGRESR